MVIWPVETECRYSSGGRLRKSHRRIIRIVIVREIDRRYRRSKCFWQIDRRYSWSRHTHCWQLRPGTDKKLSFSLLGLRGRLPCRIEADNRPSSTIAHCCRSWKFGTSITSLHAGSSSYIVAPDFLAVLRWHILRLDDGRWGWGVAGVWRCFWLFCLPSSSIEWIWSSSRYGRHCIRLFW